MGSLNLFRLPFSLKILLINTISMLLSADDLTQLNKELATPVIITESISDEEIKESFERMCVRSRATSEMLQGLIEWDTYTDIMDEYGVDIVHAQKQWSEGIVFL